MSVYPESVPLALPLTGVQVEPSDDRSVVTDTVTVLVTEPLCAIVPDALVLTWPDSVAVVLEVKAFVAEPSTVSDPPDSPVPDGVAVVVAALEPDALPAAVADHSLVALSWKLAVSSYQSLTVAMTVVVSVPL
jgi:hypothetical protein